MKLNDHKTENYQKIIYNKRKIKLIFRLKQKQPLGTHILVKSLLYLLNTTDPSLPEI